MSQVYFMKVKRRRLVVYLESVSKLREIFGPLSLKSIAPLNVHANTPAMAMQASGSKESGKGFDWPTQTSVNSATVCIAYLKSLEGVTTTCIPL
jgi:hypothetical protein